MGDYDALRLAVYRQTAKDYKKYKKKLLKAKTESTRRDCRYELQRIEDFIRRDDMFMNVDCDTFCSMVMQNRIINRRREQ